MRNIIIVLLFLSLLFVPAQALEASIQGQKTIYIEVPGPETPIEDHVTVINNNNITVNIDMSASSRIVLDEESFSLQPDEERRVDYTLYVSNITVPGNYSEWVTATFSAPPKMPVGMTATITIIATLNTTGPNENPPSAPVLVSPTDGASMHNTTVLLDWNPSTDPDGDDDIDGYYYYVDDDSDFSSPVKTGTTPETEKEITIPYGTYYWKIAASDGPHEAESDIWSFTLYNTAPPAPSLTSPADGSLWTYKPLLNWSDVTDPDGDNVFYDLLVDDNSDFSSPLIDSRVEYSQYDTVSVGFISDTYYWKVRSTDLSGYSDYSPAWSFTLDIPYCGDGDCNAGETTCSCPQDCGSSCGDGCCSYDETCYSCSADCGSCSTGDGPGGGNPGGGYVFSPPGGEEDEESNLQEELDELNNEIDEIKQSIDNAGTYMIDLPDLPDIQELLSQIEDLQNNGASEDLIDQLRALKEELDEMVPEINVIDEVTLHYNSLDDNEKSIIETQFMVKPLGINATRIIKLIEIKGTETTYMTYIEVIAEGKIIERIPKSIADNVDKIKFSTEPKITEQDPVVEFDEGFSYLVEGNRIDFVNAYERPIIYEEAITPGITGMVVQYGTILGIFAVAGIAVYFLFMKKGFHSGYRYRR